MSTYGEQGAEPVEDAAVENPPTEEEVREAQERKFPDQARTAMGHHPEPDGEEPADD